MDVPYYGGEKGLVKEVLGVGGVGGVGYYSIRSSQWSASRRRPTIVVYSCLFECILMRQ